MKVYLVACVSMKLARRAPAKELYISPWFKMARTIAEQSTWFILSAKHGLLAPDDVIYPYDETLADAPVAVRQAWAARVIHQMRDLPRCDEVVLFAGEKYREFLMGHLTSTYRRVTVPMEGLGIGRQLSWMSKRAA